MAWSIGGGATEYQSASNNNSSITAWCDIGWSSYDSYAGYNTSGIIQIDGVNYGYTGPTSINYVSYYPYYGSQSGAVRVGEKNVAWGHDTNGYRGSKTTHVYFYGGGGYAPGSLNYNTPDFAAVDYNRSANTPAMGTTTRDSTTSATIRYVQNGSVNGPTTYVVQRATDSGFSNVDKTWTNPATTFTDSTLGANTTYYYRVYAYGDEGGNKFSSPVGPYYGQPTPPQSVSVATNSSTSGAINVWWIAPSNQQRGVDYYHVYRDGISGVGTFVGTWNSGVAPTSGSPFVDTGVAARSTHTYYVYAHTSDYWSNVSTVSASGLASSVPSAPGTPTVSSKVGRTLTLNSTRGSNAYNNAISEYRIQLSTDNGTTWKGWDNTSKSFTATNTYNVLDGAGNFVYSLLTPALTYKWRAYAVNSIGTGDVATMSSGTFVGAGGKRYDGTTWQPTATSKRFDGTNWVDFTIAKRYNGTTWVDLT